MRLHRSTQLVEEVNNVLGDVPQTLLTRSDERSVQREDIVDEKAVRTNSEGRVAHVLLHALCDVHEPQNSPFGQMCEHKWFLCALHPRVSEKCPTIGSVFAGGVKREPRTRGGEGGFGGTIYNGLNAIQDSGRKRLGH